MGGSRGGGGGARHVERRAGVAGAGARARLFKGARAEPREAALRPQAQARADFRDAQLRPQNAPLTVPGAGRVAPAR